MKHRRTRSQERILQILKGQSQPISAQDLYIELRNRSYSTGLATVYRALEGLKLEGAVQMRTLPSGEAVYSLPQEDRHHLTCLRCDRTILIDECPVHELETQLHQDHQFQIFYHTLEFFGLCPACQSQERIPLHNS
ncbi:MAG: Fur family transcriptional regulator [Cyanobacteria bacterium]|nr:Fur family transcriptional regulator [Cyanobacteriota bacterium]MEB3269620.1 Fur family transcriptional regulator [Leptolyngbya sp.]